uniref:Uncharacterized protein n=1 Tax=Amphora coffeiformis TaxID=265554 RepID=A0A7S3L6V6_9STRA|mmetsp:Transcript_21331/g.40538  ORF Transcript_21331/g.40538 Transcript_21331/m.40538 type:complete len:251 (+) Transcript_21331:39-791(+)|eukprot:scaffold2490_cov169-Amphora_coffeaeformis.AAC.4
MTALTLSSQPGVSVAASLILRGGGAVLSRSGGSSAHTNKGKKSTKSTQQQSLYDAIGNRWYQIPQPLRYFVSGNLGNLCLYVLDKALRLWMESMTHPPKNIDSMAYFMAYILHVAAQHAFHAFLVYGLESVSTRQVYWSTLLGTFQAYTGSAIGSTFLNSYLVKQGWNRDIVFITTISFFSCLNYFWISYMVKREEEKAGVIEVSGSKQDGKFVGRRKQGKVRNMRGGYCAFGFDKCLDPFMTIPSAASP